MDPAMLMGAAPAAPPDQGGAPSALMAPPSAPPSGAPVPAEVVMQALMGLVPQQQAQMAQMTQDTAMTVMQALQGAADPRALGAVTGPISPGSLDAQGDI